MKKYFINYAGSELNKYNQEIHIVEKYLKQQEINLVSAKSNLNFDEYISYNDKDIDLDFYEKNKFILDQRRGAGYWLWKPYVILKTLNQMENGDLLFYLDVDHVIIENPKVDILLKRLDDDEKQMIGFQLPDSRLTLNHLLKTEFNKIISIDFDDKNVLKDMLVSVYDKMSNFLTKHNFIMNSNDSCTKRDCFLLMGLDDEKYYRDIQCAAGYVFLRKNDFTMNFVKEWLKYSTDPRALTDQSNELGQSNTPVFTHHRHDQSIYSLLISKYNVNKIKWSDFHNEIFRDTNET